MLSSNWERGFRPPGVVELAWSSVAVAEADAEICFRRVRARVEDWRDGRWKRVTMSRGLCWGGNLVSWVL